MIAGENDRAVGRDMVFSNDIDTAEERTGDDTNQGKNQALHYFEIFRALRPSHGQKK